MWDIKIEKADYNPKDTRLGFSERKPNFLINIEDLDFTFKFKYSLESIPELVKDNGTGTFAMTDLNFTIRASPSVKDNFVQF